jgi:rhamnose transport system substrate-binding protein
MPWTLSRRDTLRLLAATPLMISGCSPSSSHSSGGATGAGKIRVGLLPKKKGLPYFTSCAEGARQAAEELGNIDLIYDGPTDGSPEKGAEMIEKWTLQGVDVIAVAPNDPEVMAPAMRKARAKGVHVITWDADGLPDARSWFVNQASAQEIGHALVDTLVEDLGGPEQASGEVAIVTAYLTAANQNQWIEHIRERLGEYPDLSLVTIQPSNEDQKLAFQVTQDLLKAYPKLLGILAISSVAFPGAAEAIQQAGQAGKVQVLGLSTPNDMRRYVTDGTVRSVVLWNTEDLGYLTIRVAAALARGELTSESSHFEAGRLGQREIQGDHILLGDILVFRQDNIDQYQF